MNNKVLIRLYVPELDITYDIYIPVNELIWKIKKMLVKAISEMSGGLLDTKREYALINKTTSLPYENNKIVINTDIRNATELLLISAKTNNEGMVSIELDDKKD